VEKALPKEMSMMYDLPFKASDVTTDHPLASGHDLTQLQTEDPEVDLRRRIGRSRVSWYFHISASRTSLIPCPQIHISKRMTRLTVFLRDTRHSSGARHHPLPFRPNFFRAKMNHSPSSISMTPHRPEVVPGRVASQRTISQVFSGLQHLQLMAPQRHRR
jgi:hypothetical protein